MISKWQSDLLNGLKFEEPINANYWPPDPEPPLYFTWSFFHILRGMTVFARNFPDPDIYENHEKLPKVVLGYANLPKVDPHPSVRNPLFRALVYSCLHGDNDPAAADYMRYLTSPTTGAFSLEPLISANFENMENMLNLQRALIDSSGGRGEGSGDTVSCSRLRNDEEFNLETWAYIYLKRPKDYDMDLLHCRTEITGNDYRKLYETIRTSAPNSVTIDNCSYLIRPFIKMINDITRFSVRYEKKGDKTEVNFENCSDIINEKMKSKTFMEITEYINKVYNMCMKWNFDVLEMVLHLSPFGYEDGDKIHTVGLWSMPLEKRLIGMALCNLLKYKVLKGEEMFVYQKLATSPLSDPNKEIAPYLNVTDIKGDSYFGKRNYESRLELLKFAIIDCAVHTDIRTNGGRIALHGDSNYVKRALDEIIRNGKTTLGALAIACQYKITECDIIAVADYVKGFRERVVALMWLCAVSPFINHYTKRLINLMMSPFVRNGSGDETPSTSIMEGGTLKRNVDGTPISTISSRINKQSETNVDIDITNLTEVGVDAENHRRTKILEILQKALPSKVDSMLTFNILSDYHYVTQDKDVADLLLNVKSDTIEKIQRELYYSSINGGESIKNSASIDLILNTLRLRRP